LTKHFYGQEQEIRYERLKAKKLRLENTQQSDQIPLSFGKDGQQQQDLSSNNQNRNDSEIVESSQQNDNKPFNLFPELEVN
jgi:hypothetical protein